MKRALILTAHPDDDILGCGGVMAKYRKRGIEFRVVFLGEGTTCRFDVSEIHSIEAKKEIEIRNGFGRRALATLNIDNYHFYNLPCGRFNTLPIIDIGKTIENEIRQFKPDTIFTHSNIDNHNDHTIVSNATLIATRPGMLNLVERVYFYEVITSTEFKFTETFKPNYFVTLNLDEVELKLKAFEEYLTEKKAFPFPRSREGILSHLKVRGMQVGASFAEAFYLVREIVE